MRAALALAPLLLALATACAPVDDAAGRAVGDPPFSVVATTGMVGDAVASVGGDRVRVTTLMGPGVDPHVYKASEGDVLRLGDADLIAFNGLHLEARLSEVLERLEGRTLAVTAGIPRERLLSPPEFEGQYDPHVWFDVGLWTHAVEHVRDELAAMDPAGAVVYEANAARYVAELEALDAEVRALVAQIPERQRVLVTAHDAFNYFGRAYGFEVRGLQGISTVSEAGTADIQRVADFIAERRIPAIFVETSVSPRAIEAVQAAVRSRGFEVELGDELYSDALGDPDGPAGTYVGMVRHNVEALVSALAEPAQ
jgi:manganese/zinc/iron transport system substrate-binding protein